MKKIIFSLVAVGGMFAFISCERHEWENSAEGKKDGTKNLYKQSDSHGCDKEGCTGCKEGDKE